MDIDTIKRINREALEAAKKAQNKYTDENHMMMYVLSVLAGIVSYFFMQKYQPSFLMTNTNGGGVLEFNKTRGVIASVIVGLVFLLLYNMLFGK